MNTIIKRLTILFAVLAAIGLFTVSSLAAQEKTSGDYTYIVQDDDTVKITDYNGKEKILILPSVLDGKSVSAIGVNAFEACGIETVIIPADVKVIGECAFVECSLLTGVYIEKGLKEIRHDAFLYCENVNVYFSGSKAEWEKINIAYSNNLKVHFNASYPFDHTPDYTAKLPEGAKCGERVTVTYTCSCGDSYTKAGYAPEHTGGKATCIQEAICSRCGEPYGGFADHDYVVKYNKATLKKDGSTVVKCKICPAGENSGIISRPKSITLSTTKYTYNGKEKKPSVSVKDANGQTIGRGYYTVKYESGRKLPGKYAVTVTFDSDLYEGSKTLYYTIAPKAVGKISATATKASVTLKWSKITGVSGYKIEKYNSSSKKYETVKTVTEPKTKISDLKSGTTYKFKVRAYKKDDDTIYGAYSSVKEITTQLSAPSKVTSKGGTTSVKLSWSKSRGADGYRIYYKSGDSWKTLVKSVKGTSYTLKDLKKSTKRIYAIRAYKKTSDGTIWSDYKQFSAATKPGKSALTAKSSTGGQAVLTWKKVASANTYRVYYKVNKGDYKLYKTYSKPTKVTIKNLKGGDTCTFKVQAGIKVTGGTVWGDAVTKSVKVAYRTTKVLKAIKSGTYVIGISDPDYNGTIVIARKGDRLYISTDVGDEVTMFYSPTRDVWYYIYDMYGVYSIINDSDLPEDSNANALYAISESVTIPKSFKSTKERIDGMQMFCETAVTDGHKIKYCYSEGGSLEKIITYLDDGSAMSTDVYTFSTTVSDKLFKVPKGYKYIEE